VTVGAVVVAVVVTEKTVGAAAAVVVVVVVTDEVGAVAVAVVVTEETIGAVAVVVTEDTVVMRVEVAVWDSAVGVTVAEDTADVPISLRVFVDVPVVLVDATDDVVLEVADEIVATVLMVVVDAQLYNRSYAMKALFGLVFGADENWRHAVLLLLKMK
jgi:hypothetical protein